MTATRAAAGYGLIDDAFHAIVVHPNGMLGDGSDRLSPEAICRRYAMARWGLDPAAHWEMMMEALRVRPSCARPTTRSPVLPRIARAAVDGLGGVQAEEWCAEHRYDAAVGALAQGPSPVNPGHRLLRAHPAALWPRDL